MQRRGEKRIGILILWLVLAAVGSRGELTNGPTRLGEVPPARFGAAVCDAGDVNGDGYADLLVAAPEWSEATGRIYLYPGTATGIAASPTWVVIGEGVSNRLGQCLAGAGDINGDGYADVVVGAPGWSNESGRAYVFLGSPGGLQAEAWVAAGTNAGNRVGGAVGGGGDVNGDGYDEVIIGAPGWSNEAGRAELYWGSAAGLSTSDAWTVAGETSSNRLGYSVGMVGDLDGDGDDEVGVGEPGWQSDQGRVRVYFGATNGLPVVADIELTGETAGDWFGYGVRAAGDVDGDGLGEWAVGAPGYDGGRGRAYVYARQALPVPSWVADWTVTGTDAGDALGALCGGLGDLNGDGYGDIIVWAPYGSNLVGATTAYLGGPDGVASMADWFVLGADAYSGDDGVAVSALGDVNRDGYADVVVGDPAYGGGQGRVRTFHGRARSLGPAAGWMCDGTQAGEEFGRGVAGIGDVNGDGVSDFAVSGFSVTGGVVGVQVFAGQVGAWPGSVGPLWTGWFSVAAGAPPLAISAAGDVNGDGCGDYLVGTARDGAGMGQVHLYLGGVSGLPGSAYWSGQGEGVDDGYGRAVAGVGDVNGDGYADVLVGAPAYSAGIGAGKVYVYHGSPTGMTGEAAWMMLGETGGDGFGEAVGAAGDVNGDGYSDVIVGAPGYSSGAAQRGKAYVFLGSRLGLGTATNWIRQGTAAGSRLGSAVATAGDVNGDGYADVIVGSPGEAGAGIARGRATVHRGGASGVQAGATWTGDGGADNDRFGTSVGSAGDVNGDGYADVLVGGAPEEYGRVWLYRGHSGGVGTAIDWLTVGANGQDEYGIACAGAGDLNGDGYADVVVGAPGYPGGADVGQVSVYWGNAGGGRAIEQAQRRPDTGLRIARGGKSDERNRFDAILRGWPVAAAGGVMLEVQATLVGRAFGQAGTVTNFGDWTVAAAGGRSLTNQVTGLTIDRVYNWRARVHQVRGSRLTAGLMLPPLAPVGPWRMLDAQGLTSDVRMPDHPVVESAKASNITAVTADLWARITTARVDVVERGFLYATNAGFDTGTASRVSEPGVFGTGWYKNTATGLMGHTEYFYRASIRYSDGQKMTDEQSFLTLPAAPVVSAAAAGGDRLEVSWTQPGATNYTLQVGTTANFSTLLAGYEARKLGAVGQHTVLGVNGLSTYFCRVRGENATGTGEWSNVSQAATVVSLTVEERPVGVGTVTPTPGTYVLPGLISTTLSATVTSTGFVFVAWTNVAGCQVANRTADVTTVTMTGNASVAAVFVEPRTEDYALMVGTAAFDWIQFAYTAAVTVTRLPTGRAEYAGPVLLASDTTRHGHVVRKEGTIRGTTYGYIDIWEQFRAADADGVWAPGESVVLVGVPLYSIDTTAPTSIPWKVWAYPSDWPRGVRAWMEGYGLINYPAEAQEDADGDGALTWEEYISGTVPIDGTSVFRVTQFERRSDGNVRVLWPSVAGRVYTVQRAADGALLFTNAPGAAVQAATPPFNEYVGPWDESGRPSCYRIKGTVP